MGAPAEPAADGRALISTGLFTDGAAAVIVAGDNCELHGPEIEAARSAFYPDTLDVMGWDISEKRFKVVLSPEIQDVIARSAGRDAGALLAQHGFTRDDIGCWRRPAPGTWSIPGVMGLGFYSELALLRW